MPRHLIVHCTALESTIYPVTFFPAKATRWCCQTVSLTPPPSLPSFTISELSSVPSVIWSVTSPVILPCILQVVAFCAETNLAGSLSPFSRKKKKTLKWAAKSGRDWITDWSSFLGAFPDFLSPPPAPPKLRPSVYPSVWHPSIRRPSVTTQDWNHQSGLLEEAMVLRRAVGGDASRGPDIRPPTSTWSSTGPRALATTSCPTLRFTDQLQAWTLTGVFHTQVQM